MRGVVRTRAPFKTAAGQPTTARMAKLPGKATAIRVRAPRKARKAKLV
jgi:hypothetical protein